MNEPTDLLEEAKAVLAMNDHGDFTIPAEGLYPHQWLWDSCFVAIGLRHLDTERAKAEILHLLTGQWDNGMIPHMILTSIDHHVRDGDIWQSWVNPNAPSDVFTSGITQPPMIAESIVRIGQKMELPERRNWYRKVYPALLRHHQWLYKERDPHSEGLVLQIHPWETGLDNTPPWISELHNHTVPWWINLVKKLRLEWLLNIFRQDTHYIPAAQRIRTIDALVFYSAQRRLRRKRYEIDNILTHSLLSIEDLGFNSILIRNNQHLKAIAKVLKEKLPEELRESMLKTEKALESLWDPYSNQYYSRNFVTHKLIKEPSIATFLPLYSGGISQERAEELVKLLENKKMFGPTFPVPSVPLNSPWFDPIGYWQGPAWVNINWLIIDGLNRYGFKEQAEALRQSTLEMVRQSGFNEYFNPLTGEPEGAPNFSWTAALTIDLIKQNL